jgi:predicted dehydrogenase
VTRWRVGIIGCGWAGEQHARAVRQLPARAELCALADIDVGLVEARAAAWQVPHWTTDYRTLLARGQLDAVSICLPHHLHAPVAIEAAQNGLHVFVEKPLAVTLAEADEMIAAAEAASVHLVVAETVRFSATYTRAAQLVQEGSLGDLLLVRISREHQMHDYLRQRPWFLEQASGGIIYSGGIHDFELLRMLAGEIVHVYGLVGRRALPRMVGDDTSVILAGLAGGRVGVLVESFSLRTPTPGVHVTVHGSGGSMWCTQDRIRVYTAPQDGRQDLVEEIAVPPGDTFQAEISHFLDCLDGVSEPVTSAREERKPLLAVLAAYDSIERGERVSLADYEVRNSAKAA